MVSLNRDIFFFFFVLVGTVVQRSLSSNVTQLDLIFPRNNTVYQPVYPFPIVFATHNVQPAWDFALTVSWTLVNVRDPSFIGDFGAAQTGDRLYDYLDGNPRYLFPEGQLLIHSTPMLANTTGTEFRLDVEFSLYHNCSPPVQIHGTRGAHLKHQIFFNISRDGELPQMQAGGMCAMPIAAYELADPETDIYRSGCTQLLDPPPALRTCAFEIDASLQRQVEAQMLNHSGCALSSPSWPNVTGLVGPCPISRSLASSAAKASIPTAPLALLWVMWMAFL